MARRYSPAEAHAVSVRFVAKLQAAGVDVAHATVPLVPMLPPYAVPGLLSLAQC